MVVVVVVVPMYIIQTIILDEVFETIRNNRDARQVLSAEAEDWGYNTVTLLQRKYLYYITHMA